MGHFKAFDVLKTRIGRHKLLNKAGQDITPFPKFGCSCNPSKGWPKRVFYDPAMAGTLPPQYAFIQSLYSDNPYTAKDYGDQLGEISNLSLKQRLKDGNWNYDEDAGTLMKYDNTSAKIPRYRPLKRSSVSIAPPMLHRSTTS
jgi:hypothetical protein